MYNAAAWGLLAAGFYCGAWLRIRPHPCCNPACRWAFIRRRPTRRCRHRGAYSALYFRLRIQKCARPRTYKRARLRIYKRARLRTYKRARLRTYKRARLRIYKRARLRTYKRARLRTYKRARLRHSRTSLGGPSWRRAPLGDKPWVGRMGLVRDALDPGERAPAPQGSPPWPLCKASP